jgi:coenzyme F420-reducing hydrogenase delta subunit
MCSSGVDPVVLVETMIRGADGVLIAGCHEGDCHYESGNYQAERRVRAVRKVLEMSGIEPQRVRLEWVSASEGKRFAELVDGFVDEIRQLGPNPAAGDQPDIDTLERLYVARNVLNDFRLNLLVNKEEQIEEKSNVYGETVPKERMDAILDTVTSEEFSRCNILMVARDTPSSVQQIAERVELPQGEVLDHIVVLVDRGLLKVDQVDNGSPLYLTIPQEQEGISTLPAWARVQKKGIEMSIKNLPDVDETTKKWIVRELLLTLRCHNCERRRSDVCHFSVCIRGLMSGVVE